MTKFLKGILILTALVTLSSCTGTRDESRGHTHGAVNADVDITQPVSVYIALNDKGIPKPAPETVTAYPGQEMVFYANKQFELVFVGRSPTDPRSRKRFNFYKSDESSGDEYKSVIKVSPDYRGLPVLEGEKQKITREDLAELAKELGVELSFAIHDTQVDKTPIDEEKFVYIHYLIRIGDTLYDPGARIIKL